MRTKVALFALLVAFSSTAVAATFTVTTTADSGAGSFRDAVAQANASPGADTINFAVTGTITLTSGRIAITSGPLTIVGPGADQLAIDGNASDLILLISEPNAPACPALTGPSDYLVTLSGVTLQRGVRNTDSSSGAIQSTKSLTLDSVIVRDNIAPRAAGVNFAAQYDGQALTIVNSQFLNNAARPPASGSAFNSVGGALRVIANCDPLRPLATVTISRSLFSGNSAEPTTNSAAGAAIAIFTFGPVTITDSRIVDNHVDLPTPAVVGRTYRGGGISGHAKTLTIERTEIAENSAEQGAGIYIFNDFADLQTVAGAFALRLVNSTVSSNTAIVTGGGLRLFGNVAAEVYNSTVAYNLGQAQAVAGINITTGATNPPSASNARPPSLKLVSSIVSNPTVSAADVGIALGGVIPIPFVIDATNSLVQNPGLSVQVGGSDNLVGVSPYLGPLAFNGGSTRTHDPRPASLVIDRGANPLGLTTDQRGAGFIRVQNTVADMGAYESTSTFKPSTGFTTPVSYAASNPQLRVSNDLTGDSLADLASVDTTGNSIDVLINNGDGTFAATSYTVGSQPALVVSCDLNGDNLRDLVIPNKGSNTLSILINQANGTFAPASPIQTGSQPAGVNCQAALSTPLRHQLHMINGGDSTFMQFADDGAGTFSLKATVPVGADPRAVATTDFDSDSLWDAVTFNFASNSVTVLRQAPAFTFTPTEYPVQAGPVTGNLTDVTGDGKLDIVALNATANSISVLVNNGGATFKPAVHYGVGANPRGQVILDFNGDNRNDIAVRNVDSNDIAVLLNNGDGTFAPAVFYPVGGPPVSFNMVDLDGDAVPDLVVAVGSSNTIATLYGKGDGTFKPAVFTTLTGAPGPTLQLADLNGDGRPDIAVPLPGENKIAVLLNTTVPPALGLTPRFSYQGLWWRLPGGSESGWGINFTHQGDTIFATWFTYGADGKPVWFAAVLTKGASNVYSGDVFTTTGPPFDAVPFDSSQVVETVVGTMSVTFFLSGNAYVAYTVNGISQSKTITRQLFSSPVPTCIWGAAPDLSFASNYQDLWWKFPAGSESGHGINLTHQGDVIFVTWFTYGADGKPLWFIAVANRTATRTYAGALSTVKGPPFFAVPFDPGQVVETEVGNVTLTFVDGNRATFAYTVNGKSQTKEITRQIFAPPGTVCF